MIINSLLHFSAKDSMATSLRSVRTQKPILTPLFLLTLNNGEKVEEKLEWERIHFGTAFVVLLATYS